MSKGTLKSKTAITRPGSRRRRILSEKDMNLKPFGFCCSVDNFDPLTSYNQQQSLHKSSLTPVHVTNESPVLKFRTEFPDYIDFDQISKAQKNKTPDVGDQRLRQNRTQTKQKQSFYQSQKSRRLYKHDMAHDNLHKLRDHKRNIFKRYKQTSHNSQNIRKLYESRNSYNLQNDVGDLYDAQVTRLLNGPLEWYLEDEIAAAKDIVWKQKQDIRNEEVERNVNIGRRNSLNFYKNEVDTCPRWYQDFSIDQVKNLMTLQSVIHQDCEEMVTGRTQRTLITIGIISTFFNLTSDVIRQLQESSNCNAIDFLREVYKILTGNYFEEEGYKRFYDCNERIILSAIAFLTLPEAVIELHKRLPPVLVPKLPPKPVPPTIPVRKKMASPYEEELFTRPDWVSYYNNLQNWRVKCELMAIPRIILPPKDCILTSYNSTKLNYDNGEDIRTKIQRFSQKDRPSTDDQQNRNTRNNPSIQMEQKYSHAKEIDKEQKRNTRNNPSIQMEQTYSHTKEIYKEQKRNTRNNPSNQVEQKRVSAKEEYREQKQDISKNPKERFSVPIRTTERASTNNSVGKRRRSSLSSRKKRKTEVEETDNIDDTVEEMSSDSQEFGPDIPQLPDKSKVFDFTINGISDTPGPVEYKICGVLQPPQPNKKSWLGEKDAHYIITGAPDEPPSCPITYEMTGVANVTPTNSDERFFTVLKLGDGPKKIYPSGREHLSPKWQEWLQNADEEYRKIESEANKMIKRIKAITRLVFPGPTCDSCCSCRQSRKTYLKAKETKAPYFVIETLTEDNKKNKYIVGSMAMHSPAPTPPESTVNLLEYIASEDVLTTNVLINGVTNEIGETQYFISGFKKDMVRRPGRIVERPPPRPPRNVPPCACAIQHIFTKGLSLKISHDHIPWTKDDGLCFGKKFRPNESPAYSCKMYPGDKSCRRNPFIHEIKKMQRRAEREKEERERIASPKEKKMYSIADFQPCGDEHGMSICGGPWGALHTLTPEELAEQERIRKEILRGPPCGTKPGRAVCEGPFGTRIPLKRPQIEIEEIEGDEELGDEEEETEEETEEEEEETPPAPVVEEKKKEKKRGKKCYMSPESIAGRKKVVTKKKEKFIPDPTYPGYDDPWNVFRTAPSEKESETDFKTLLKLSTPEPRATSAEPKAVVDESEIGEQSPSQKDVLKSPKKDSTRVSIKDTKKTSVPTRSTSARLSKKHMPQKSKSDSKVKDKVKKKPKSVDRIGNQGIFSKPSQTSVKSRETPGRIAKDKKAGDKTEDKKSLKSEGSKSTQKRMNERSVSPKYSEKENKLAQVRSAKSTDRSIQSKSEIKGTHSRQKKVSKKSDFKIKQKESITSKKSKSSAVKTDKKIAVRRNQSNKNIITNKQDKEGEIRKRSFRKRSSSRRTREEVGKRKKSFRKRSSSARAEKEGEMKKKSLRKQSSSARTGREGEKRKKSPRKQSSAARFGQRKRSKTRQTREDKMETVEDGVVSLTPQEQIQKLKNMMKSEMYPYDVKPVELPEEPPAKCTLEYEEEEDTKGSVQVDEEEDAQLPSKGPCGWRTKSEQQLPTKKTLVYLTEPDYPAETIEVRPGGKVCVCRENRDKKKVLMYNIGGYIGGKTDDTEDAKRRKIIKSKESEDDKQTQVIDGILYYTPPPSPRRSEEYVPEYDLYESPYDMCQTRRKDEYLKLYEEYSGPKSLVSKVLKRPEPCDCNEFVDTYGIQTTDQNDEEQAAKELDKIRQDLIEAKPPKERWNIALKDVGLIDYYTRCRDTLPCWLKCAKFNKVGCSLPYQKLKIKRPVCECKYERKIIEYKEEKRKYKERRARLQSLKKQPFVNVENISRPIVADTKLMISGVKRIPREDEYIDDVKYCITGVAENYTTLPPEKIVGGVQMGTPLRTPEESVEEMPCVCLHRHWSPITIPPGPLPKPEEILLAEKKRRQRIAEETYQQIYAPQEVYDTHGGHSCKATCNQNSDAEDDENTEENNDNSGNVTTHMQRIAKGDQIKKESIDPRKRAKQQSRSSNNKGGLDTKNVVSQKVLGTTKRKVINPPKQMKQQLRLSNINGDELDTRNARPQKVHETTVNYSQKKNKSIENEVAVQKISDNPQKPRYNEVQNVNLSSIYQQNRNINTDTGNIEIIDEEKNENLIDTTTVNIMIMVQVELRKMADEGFLFAKLPKCFLMPQLQYWLMYRKGFTLTEKDKENSIHKSIVKWNIIETKRPPRVEPLQFKMSKVEQRKLTFDRAEEMKEKIAKKKEIFYSQLRKERVLYSRAMWNAMDYGKFPSTSFKRTYFTYMASREADGHVFKPWQPFEIREMVN